MILCPLFVRRGSKYNQDQRAADDQTCQAARRRQLRRSRRRRSTESTWVGDVILYTQEEFVPVSGWLGGGWRRTTEAEPTTTTTGTMDPNLGSENSSPFVLYLSIISSSSWRGRRQEDHGWRVFCRQNVRYSRHTYMLDFVFRKIEKDLRKMATS